MGRVSTYSRKCTTDSLLDRRYKKESRLSQMGYALKAWVKACKVKTETSRVTTKACWLELRDIKVELVVRLLV